MQDRCHVRITGCSSFLTFHAGVESVGPLSRDRRPLKRNQLQKEADFLLLKTGARPKRNSRRDVGSLKKKKPTSLEAGFSDSEWCPRRESNSHVFRQRFLRPPRLPFRHSGAKSNYTRCSRKRKPKFQNTRKKQRYRPKIVRTGTKAETRRLRFEYAEARRPFGSWGPMRRTIRGESNRPETR